MVELAPPPSRDRHRHAPPLRKGVSKQRERTRLRAHRQVTVQRPRALVYTERDEAGADAAAARVSVAHGIAAQQGLDAEG